MDQDTNTTGLYGDNRQAPYDMDRADRTQLLAKMSFPESYRRNTSKKEDLALDFVDDFRSQYIALFPRRAPLLLSPENECKCRKFISTYIRPTPMRFNDLYDYQTCAAFISGYVRFESVDSAELMARVTSPTTVLQWQVGNCVEMSILLTSLLIGNGYNAYVVVGYATEEISKNDQTNVPWPDTLPAEVCSDDEADERSKTEEKTKYAEFIKKRPMLVSQFDRDEEARRLAELEQLNKPADNEGNDEEEAEADFGRQPHAWVVLLPNKRKIEKATFIEPSTGTTFQQDDPRYMGIEAVFNNHNYFVNMKPDAAVSAVQFDLRDLTHWENVFLRDPELDEEEEVSSPASAGSGAFAAADEGESGDMILDLPTSWVEPLTLSRAQFENRFPGRQKTIVYANRVRVSYFAEYSQPDLKVREIVIPDDETVHEQIHTFYKHRQDKLRRRAQYPTFEKATQFRKVHDWFSPGRKKESRVEGLRELIFEPGVSRVMRFYWRAREDGLAKRVELFFDDKDLHPRKIKEFYRGREEDRLIYRSATYEAPKETGITVGLQHTLAREEASRTLLRMAEKFDRNPALDPDHDYMKRTYVRPTSSDGEIWVFYQYRDDCITCPFRLFPKNAEKEKEASSQAVQSRDRPKVVTMPFAEPPKESELVDELRILRAKEGECLQELKAKMDECAEILETRADEMKVVKRVLSVYDTLRSRPKESDAELAQTRAKEARRAESLKDYLAPFIANVDTAKTCKGDYANIVLTPEQAKRVRDDALRDLKERLIQRGHIMQARMDREKEELNRRQMLYQKNLDANEGTKESEEFAQFCKEATWRMRILDDRLSKHIDQASEKYAELAQRLAEDKRLAALYH